MRHPATPTGPPQLADELHMLLFIVIALSVLWICGCVLGLALGAMLAPADVREPARPARRRPERSDRFAALERALPTA